MNDFPLRERLRELEDILAHWNPTDDEGGLHRERLVRLADEVKRDLIRLGEREEARRNETLQLEIALIHTDNAVVVIDRDGAVRLMNPAFAEIVGADPAVGTPLLSLLSPLDPKAKNAFSQALADAAPYQGEFGFRPATGGERIVDVTATPIDDQLTGKTTHHVLTLRDVTERVAAQREIAGKRSLLESLINLSPGIILALSPTGEWRLDNLATKTLLADMGHGGRERLSALALEAVRHRKGRGAATMAAPLASGAIRWFSILSETIPESLLMPKGGSGNVYLISMTDVTDILVKEREVAARGKALAALAAERVMAQDELANGLVFRMRQPVNVAKAMGSQLAMKAGRGDCAGAAESAIILNRQLTELEEALTSFSRMSRTIPVEGECRLPELIDTLSILYTPRAREERVALTCHRGEGHGTAPMEETVLLMVAASLVDNAFDAVARRSDAAIGVSFHLNQREVSLSVADNGDGIDDDRRLKLFEPFYSTRSDRQGLSLTLAMSVVNKAGGRIDIDTPPGGGARFTVSLPVSMDPDQ